MDGNLMTAIYAVLIAFAVSAGLCPLLIPILVRLKFGQNVRGDGPQTHLKKAGTPIMGGIVIVIGLLAASLLFMDGDGDIVAVLLVTAGFGVIGFIDDYLKMVKKRSLGLRAYQKIILQLTVTAVFVFCLHGGKEAQTSFYIPFTENKYIDLGMFYYPLVFITMIGAVNSVNLTDGLDGLAAGVTVLVSSFFLFVSLGLKSGLFSVNGAAVGALLGFLLFNSHPAKIFMGDTGSLALGGLVASVAVILRMPLVLFIVGIIYVAEAVSVILQVGFFKLTKGRRIFKMAPIHHHFEKQGWQETRIVAVFYIITAIACLIGFIAVRNIF